MPIVWSISRISGRRNGFIVCCCRLAGRAVGHRMACTQPCGGGQCRQQHICGNRHEVFLNHAIAEIGDRDDGKAQSADEGDDDALGDILPGPIRQAAPASIVKTATLTASDMYLGSIGRSHSNQRHGQRERGVQGPCAQRLTAFLMNRPQCYRHAAQTEQHRAGRQ